MNTQLNLQEDIERLFEKWSQDIRKLSEDRQKIEYCRKELPVILKDTAFFIDILEKITK